MAGRPPDNGKEAKKGFLTARVHQDVVDWIAYISEQTGKTRTAVIEEAVWHLVNTQYTEQE